MVYNYIKNLLEATSYLKPYTKYLLNKNNYLES